MAPTDLLETIVEMRAFAHAKTAVDQAKSQKDIPDTALCRLVQAIEFDLVREAQEEAEARG